MATIGGHGYPRTASLVCCALKLGGLQVVLLPDAFHKRNKGGTMLHCPRQVGGKGFGVQGNVQMSKQRSIRFGWGVACEATREELRRVFCETDALAVGHIPKGLRKSGVGTEELTNFAKRIGRDLGYFIMLC